MRRKYWKKKKKEHNIAHIENLLQTSKGKQTNKQIEKKMYKIHNYCSKKKRTNKSKKICLIFLLYRVVKSTIEMRCNF